MKFFSGFSLQNEEAFFTPFLKRSDMCISGFSYGAIKAYRETLQQLASGKRVDTLQLFSPAFFQTKSEKFKRLQMLSYVKDKEAYLKNFIDACFSPYRMRDITVQETTKEELNELLTYEWEQKSLEYIVNKGVTIEVYLGGEDKIIDVNAARKFFINVATVTYIKEANHFLLSE